MSNTQDSSNVIPMPELMVAPTTRTPPTPADPAKQPYPHPGYDAARATAHIAMGCRYYRRQQTWRMWLTIVTVACVLATACAGLDLLGLKKDWAPAIGLAAFAVTAVLSTLVTNLQLVRCKDFAASYFFSAERMMFENTRLGTVKRDDSFKKLKPKELEAAKPEDWFPFLSTLDVNEAKYLVATLQESNFRVREHFWAMCGASVIMTAGMAGLVIAVYSYHTARLDQMMWLVAFLPVVNPALKSVTTNAAAWWVFRRIREEANTVLKLFGDANDRERLAINGKRLMEELVTARASHAPVCWCLYKMLRHTANTTVCESLVEDVNGKSKATP